MVVNEPFLDRPALLRRVFKFADVDGDGGLSMDEFKALAASQSTAALSMQEAVFNMLDADQNAQLSVEEFVEFNLQHGAELSDVDFSQQANAWLYLAKNRSGKPANDAVEPLFTMLMARFGKQNGRLSVDECATLAALLEVDQERLKRLLSDNDQQKTGGDTVDDSEFHRALTNAIELNKLVRQGPVDVQAAARRAIAQLKGIFREPVGLVARFTGDINDALRDGIKAHDDKLCEELIAAKADPNFRDSSGNTPLHLACSGDRTDTAKCLVRAGANVTIQNAEGHTALVLAAPLLRSKLNALVQSMEAVGRV